MFEKQALRHRSTTVTKRAKPSLTLPAPDLESSVRSLEARLDISKLATHELVAVADALRTSIAALDELIGRCSDLALAHEINRLARSLPYGVDPPQARPLPDSLVD